MSDEASRTYRLLRRTPEGAAPIERRIAVETPVAIEFNGIGYAVMMATPADFEDFALGFALSERIVSRCDDVRAVDAFKAEAGWLLRITLSDACLPRVAERVRHRVAESSCGLCGIENLEQALRPLPKLTARAVASADAVFTALASLSAQQPLNAATGAVHAAAFCDAAGAPLLVREDVGRHNALDKLIGALARGKCDPAAGFFLLSARCSFELVEKTIIAGCPLLATVSAPTSLAIDRARQHGLTLVALARSDAILVAHDPHRLFDDLSARSA